MAHPQQVDFCKSVKNLLPHFFHNNFVVDIGSLDINGNNQYLFDDCLYIGIDLFHGKNVDLATTGHELKLPDGSVDVIISTECFEHDRFYSLTLRNIVRMLKPGGLFVFSCATTGRPEHGTRKTTPSDAPFIQELDEWGDYYKNLEESDIRQVLNVDVLFEKYAFSIGLETNDLYFWGLKKGSFISRQDYSFQIQKANQLSELKTRERFALDLLSTVNDRDKQISDVIQSVSELNSKIVSLSQAVDERDRQISGVILSVTERDSKITSLNQTVSERDRQISDVTSVVAARNSEVESLRQIVNERDGEIAILSKTVDQRDSQISEVVKFVAERDSKIIRLSQTVIERDSQISDVMHSISERHREISSLSQLVDQRDRQISDSIKLVEERDSKIVSLSQTVNELDVEILYVTQSVVERDSKVASLSQTVADRNVELWALLNSNSLRLTKPLRVLGRLMRGEFDTISSHLMGLCLKTIATVLRRSRVAIGYIVKGDFEGLTERYRVRKQILTAREKNVAIASIQTAVAISLEQKCWGIMTTEHTQFIAHLVAAQLQQHNYKTEIMTEVPADFHHDWYIVICPQMFKKIPPGEKRICFQMEQSVSSRWFTDDYLRTLENSLAVLEYALINIDFMASKGVVYPHVNYLPVGASSNYFKSPCIKEKTCDILFYGDSKSSLRRCEMLDALGQHFNVRVVNEIFGHDMREAIKQARLVINLHYYENALLEMPRIQECLSLGVPVVSESAQDQTDYPELIGVVRFFEQGSVSAMLDAVKDALENPVSAEKISASVAQSAQRFAFMFDRFLVAMGFLPASKVNHMNLHLPASAARVALSMPETIARRRIFEIERPAACAVFDGIRRRPGWVGCGLSYLALANHAKKHGVNRLTVMEDDVILPQDFEKQIAIVEEFLDARSEKWDVFAGLIAALHLDAKILDVEVYKGITFVTINKMTSMVFNIYSEKALNLLAKWDPENLDSAVNTIDRFLEAQTDLRVIVTLPFFAGHREEVHSTLWGFQNTQYNDMISNSERLLKSMMLATNLSNSPYCHSNDSQSVVLEECQGSSIQPFIGPLLS